MKQLHFDGVSGVSGDMFVGALLDLGADWEKVVSAVDALGLDNVKLSCEEVTRSGVAARWFRVLDATSGAPVEQGRCPEKASHRHLSHMIEIIRAANLDPEVEADGCALFRRLARAEAHVHGVSEEQVHFHEVGGDDTLADLIGAAAAFRSLGVERAVSATVRLGGGLVRCAHGMLPVPAPATLELLKGFSTQGGPVEMELTTPTGAALLSHYCDPCEEPLPMRVEATGYGAGSRELTIPNVFRATLGVVA